MKISSIIISTLCAAAAGVIAGTLIAPDKGYKTRRNLAKKGHNYKDYLQDNFDDLSDSISHSFETLEDETKRLSKKAKANAKEVKAMVN
ncbi:YtxH domain-containing protein [Rhodohalobacter sp. SW132]|uniref:YtxH domain-containing protein n=1 Tax=Rhodohalobacter sp. SW132 TaxID=2293433 RepID=UPI000E26A362|nr:YtxH domain-containing protein [Rhodohalobacter sp. SW132]REL32889.1 YtxH domain-containing protein [Rhodohalobacter sp. SW132]